MHKKYERRLFLKGVGKAALALPWIQTMGFGPEVFAQTTGQQKYFVLFFLPWFMAYDKFRPIKGNGNNFTIPTGQNHILEGLLPHKNNLSILHGVGSIDTCGHVGAAAHLFAGTTTTDLRSNMCDIKTPKGPTFDQMLADGISIGTPFPSYQMEVREAGSAYDSGGQNSFYRSANAPLPNKQHPEQIFNELFANVAGGSDPAMDAEKRRDKSILDYTLNSLNKIMNSSSISKMGKTNLGLYAQSIRDIENKINSNRSCSKPDFTNPYGNLSNWPIQESLSTMLDLSAAALACDLTRVITIQVLAPGSNASHAFLKGTDTLMDESLRAEVDDLLGRDIHNKSTHNLLASDGKNRDGQFFVGAGGHSSRAMAETILLLQRHYVKQIGTFIDRLKSYSTPTGNLFDQTVIMGVNELNQGGHDFLGQNASMPTILAHGGDIIKTNQFLDFPNVAPIGPCNSAPWCHQPNRYFNDLHVALANAFGIPITSFGDPTWNRGALPGIV